MIRASLATAAKTAVRRRATRRPTSCSSFTSTLATAASARASSTLATAASSRPEGVLDRRRSTPVPIPAAESPSTLALAVSSNFQIVENPDGDRWCRSSLRSFSAGTKTEKEKDGVEGGIEDGDGSGQKKKKRRKKESLEEAVNRLKSKDGEGGEPEYEATSGVGNDAARNIYHAVASTASTFFSGVSSTWKELLDSGKAQSINKRIHEPLKKGETAEDDDAAADKYEGTTALMTIDPEEHLTAWERMQRRLSEAPIIQNILSTSHEIYEKSGAKQIKQKADHLSEDAREAWETSQNPWVYRISSVYDTLTAESEYAVAVRELRKLDPDFTLESWKRDVVEHTLPEVMQLFIEGRIKDLQPWLGESVYNRLAAEMRARKKEGVYIDTHILSIMNSEILACEPDTVEKGSPIILLHYMCQQINCVRKKEDDSIVEGAEDDIRANSYVAAFQREYDEERGELNWKIVDFRFNGAIAYL